MQGPLYRIAGLRVELAGRQVLDIPALEVPRGGVTAIVGANGTGKTTLLRVLAFLLAPAAGVVEFEGRPVSWRERDLVALRRRATLVAQSPLLFRRSVRANVAYGVRAHGLGRAGRSRAALEAVGLAGCAGRPAWKLSGGESRRVAIARALAIDPPVYLLDEPTANVDREHVAAIEGVIARLGAGGRTVILATHDLDQAYRLGGTVLSMVAGRVSAAPLVNVLRGRPARAGGACSLLAGPLRVEVPGDVEPRAIAIDPEDIIVSRASLDSSARNCFPGTIVKVAEDERGVLVTTDCGHRLVARITRRSYDEMGLNLGTRVYVTFKSSAIHVLDPAPQAAAG